MENLLDEKAGQRKWNESEERHIPPKDSILRQAQDQVIRAGKQEGNKDIFQPETQYVE